MVEGATFQAGSSFTIYAPISHHAIELKPVQPDTIVKFSKLEIPNILNGRELFQGMIVLNKVFSKVNKKTIHQRKYDVTLIRWSALLIDCRDLEQIF